MPLFLFDIDGTLVRMGGAGSRAMNQTFEALFGLGAGFAGIDFRGGLDPLLVTEALTRAGLEASPATLLAFQERFFPTLAAACAEGRREVCPGARELLDTLAGLGSLGLVTGNWREGARIKLGVFGLWEGYFDDAPSAFGDDAPTRRQLAAVAVERARAAGHDTSAVYLFGDTPADVESGRHAGAVTVAVATGWNTREELVAACPDLLLDDLASGREQILAHLDRTARSAPPPLTP